VDKDSGIGGDAATVEFQLQATVEIDPQGAIILPLPAPNNGPGSADPALLLPPELVTPAGTANLRGGHRAGSPCSAKGCQQLKP
jgi:hypothetical protein